MNIIISANNNEEIIIMPVESFDDIEISQAQDNEEFDTLHEKQKLIGNLGLRSFSINSLLPSRQYPWMKKGSIANPVFYIDWIEKKRLEKIPLRIIITKDDGSEWLNMAFVIDNFTHTLLKNGDVNYVLDISEYGFAKRKVL